MAPTSTLFALRLLVFPATEAGAQQAAAPLVFDQITVVDVERGRLFPARRVVIIGNRITAMGPTSAVKRPRGSQVVDGRGKYLIPGLWDMHIHPRNLASLFYPLLLANGVTGIRDASSTEPLDTLVAWRREILAGIRVGPPRQLLVGPAIHSTDVASPVVRSTEDLEQNLERYITDSIDVQRVVDSLRAAGTDMLKLYDLSPHMYFALAAEARRQRMPFGGHLEAVGILEASDSGARIVDHVYGGGMGGTNHETAFKLCWAYELGASLNSCRAVAAHFRAHNTWLVPTIVGEMNIFHGASATLRTKLLLLHACQSAAEFLRDSTDQASWFSRELASVAADTSRPGTVNDTVRAALRAARLVEPALWRAFTAVDSSRTWQTLTDSLGHMRLMHRVGLPILAGTDILPNAIRGEGGKLVRTSLPDCLPGFSLHGELAVYVAEGLTPLDALQAATLNPAKMWHATDSLGTVAVGKLADLVLLNANPLDNITNTAAIRAVVANGHYYDRAALDRLIAVVKAQARRMP